MSGKSVVSITVMPDGHAGQCADCGGVIKAGDLHSEDIFDDILCEDCDPVFDAR